MYFVIFLAIVGGVAEQTNWMGGDGALGPVSGWGTRYYAGDSITAATEGQVSLVATQWDYTSSGWAKHVAESNSGIMCAAQGFMPADIDGNGVIDLVAHTADEVVWYYGNYVLSKNVIGPADDGGTIAPCVYPCDLDEDGDMDVLVATAAIGVGWFEQQSLTWIWHDLDASIGYHRVSAVDIELDGDLDVIAVNNTGTQSFSHGDICLFRDTTGTQDFKKELVVDLPDLEGWRVYSVDFNSDGYPDLYSVEKNAYVFLNDSTGHFAQSWHENFWPSGDFDGAWPSDIDMDGDMDLVCGVAWPNMSAVGMYGLLNDGTGAGFDSLLLAGTETGVRKYGDGSISRDIDMDGLPDIAGSYMRVGWFRQDSLLAFSLYDIDTVYSSHWIYAAPLSEKCIPSVDLMVTGVGTHVIYENQMLKAFASLGHLESSILKIERPDSICDLKYFGYEACVPNDTALSFYWRAGTDIADIVSKPWVGPQSVTTIGIPCIVDSFVVGIDDACMFQYKAEFKNGDDIAVLYKVWLTYDCAPLGIDEEPGLFRGEQEVTITFLNDGKLLLDLMCRDKISLEVYDIAGRLVKNIFDGHLSSGVHQFDTPKKTGVYFAVLNYPGGARTLKYARLR